MQVEKIKLYEDREDVTLTAYVIADSPELLNGAKRPGIIICPGGGYISCSDREAEPVALRFAAMGYHAFVLRYSTYNEGSNAFPDLSKPISPKKHCQHPAPMREIGKAMLIVRKHADEWLVDTDKIAICGFSAGAHNTAMFGTYWHTPVLSEYFHEKPEAFKPAALILGYTLSDYIFMKNIAKNMMDEAFFEASNTAFLGEAKPGEERLDEVSPARHVTEHTPPTFLWATAEDTLVPVQHTLRMAHALADRHIPFEMHVFEEGPHGLALATQATAGAKSQISADAAKWTELADKWLEKRFALNMPEMTEFEEMLNNGNFM